MPGIRQPAPPPSTLVLGRYRLQEAIGSGAYGTVWSALDERLDRVVAVKAIPADLAGERAEREIRAAARVEHPGIVTLHEAASDSTHTYLVSEFIRGETLQALYSGGRASDRDIARIGAALAAAVDHAHSLGVVHRDIKPGNILIPSAPRSEAGVAKLADFGIARLAGDHSLTVTGDVVGTLAYMSPEQASGLTVDGMSDLWSLAVVLHEGFTGRNPLRGRTPAETARNLADADVELLGDVRPDLPEQLTDALERALEADPDDRCDVVDLGGALAAAVAELDDEPGTLAPAVRRSDRRLTGRRRQETVVRIPAGAVPEIPDQAETIRQAADPGPVAAPIAPRPADQVHHHLHVAAPSPARDLLRRAVAALGAAAATALWMEELAPAGIDRHPIEAAGVVGVVTLLLPRLGWIVAVLAAVIATAAAGRPGEAMVLAAALFPCVPLLWRAPQWWSLPTLAPLFGAPGLGGAWPAVASLASSVWLRAAAGAVGAWQMACAELLLGTPLLGTAPPSASSSAWAGSPVAAVREGLMPMVSGQLPAIAAAWAAAAILLPVLVSGRTAVRDALGGAAWAVGLALSTWVLAGVRVNAVLAGALAGAALIVAWRGLPIGARLPAGTDRQAPTMGEGSHLVR